MYAVELRRIHRPIPTLPDRVVAPYGRSAIFGVALRRQHVEHVVVDREPEATILDIQRFDAMSRLAAPEERYALLSNWRNGRANQSHQPIGRSVDDGVAVR